MGRKVKGNSHVSLRSELTQHDCGIIIKKQKGIRIMKMKKVIAALAAAAIVASLCACTANVDDSGKTDKSSSASSAAESSNKENSDKESSTDESSAADTDSSAEQTDSELASVVAVIKKEVKLPDDMDDFSARRLERLTGISADEIDDFAGMICTNGVSQDQMIFIKAKSLDDVDGIVEKLKTHHDAQYSVTKNYNPEQAVLFENSDVETDGLYISLVISPDADKINSIYKENLNK